MTHEAGVKNKSGLKIIRQERDGERERERVLAMDYEQLTNVK